MKIQLSDHFTFNKLLRYTLPSIVMMIFTSIYSVVDGFFVSNFVGKSAFTAVNFIMPVLMILGSVGMMFGTGGSALISKTMGQGHREKANGIFSFLVYSSIVLSVIIAVVGIIFIRPIAELLDSTNKLDSETLDYCVLYSRIILAALPAYTLQFEFQSFTATANKPHLGLIVTIAAGVTNMALDALFVGALKWGLVGAAAATAMSQVVGGVVPLIYFFFRNSSLLRLRKPDFDFKALIKTCANGSSELLSNISMSVVSILYNSRLLQYAGEDGVAAYGVMMYVNFVFLAIFIGFSIGSAPIISFHYGAGNKKELKGLLKKSLVFIFFSSVAMVAISMGLSGPLSQMFVGFDKGLFEMTVRGFRIFSLSFLFAGLAINGSSFFTALNNGLISAVISFLRTLVFQIAAVLLLPLIWDLDGIWVSIVVAEVMAALLSALFLIIFRKKYFKA